MNSVIRQRQRFVDSAVAIQAGQSGDSALLCQISTTPGVRCFCCLTPELSRPVAGRRTRASVAHSTWPTPRRGVGLNELLGK